MAFVLSDRVKETTTTTGTGAVTLAGAVTGFQAFSDRMSNGDTTHYAILGSSEWEVGIGTWNTGGTLTRSTVLQSSNSDNAVSFSAGTKTVIMSLVSDHTVLKDRSQTLTNKTLTTPTIAQINNSSAPGVKLQLRTQTDNSNSISSATTAGVFVQMGWGQTVGDGSTANITDAVTFPTAFTTVLGVSVSFIGIKTSVAADITELNIDWTTASQAFNINAGSITTSGFNAVLHRSAGAFSNTTYYGYSWIAWGI